MEALLQLLKRILKWIFFLSLVLMYNSPHLISEWISVQVVESYFKGQSLENLVRFVLSSISYALVFAHSSRYFVIFFLILAQIILWSVFLSEKALLLQQHEVDLEKRMIRTLLVGCFTALLYISLFGQEFIEKEQERFRNRLVEFYSLHNPEKLSEVDAIMEKYKDSEDLLFRRLHKKYNHLQQQSSSIPYDTVDEIEQDSNAEEDEVEPKFEEQVAKASEEIPITSSHTNDEEIKQKISRRKSPRKIDSTAGSTRKRTTTTISKAQAIEEARKAQEARIQERIQQLSQRSKRQNK